MRPTKTLLLLVLFTGDADPALAGDKATPPPAFQIDPAARRVVRRDAGTVRWSMSLPGDVRGVRLPHLLWDAKRVYVRHRDGLTALAAETGVVVWHAEGPTERLVLSRSLLLTTGNAGGDRWVVARTVCTGAEVLKIPLPLGAIAGLPLGDDRAFLGGKEVVRLSSREAVRWRTPLAEGGWQTGGLAEAGGDVVVFLYGSHSDSGVQLLRLKGVTGEVRWRARCASLGVKHSVYFHQVALAVEGDRLRVTSHGSYGTIVEVLDLKTGRRLSRTVSRPLPGAGEPVPD